MGKEIPDYLNDGHTYVDSALICADCGKCYEVYDKYEGIPLLPDIIPTCECGCTTFKVVDA